MKNKKALRIIGIIAAVVVVASGWGTFLFTKHQSDVKQETAWLQQTFTAQIGAGVTLKELYSPEKVYIAIGETTDKTTIYWNIGGIWVAVRELQKTTEAE